MINATKIAKFCQTNFYHDGNVVALKAWLIWYRNLGLTQISVGNQGLNGVLVWRPMEIAPHPADCYHLDPQGRILWLDLVITKAPQVLRILWKKVRETASSQEFDFVGARRSKHGGRVSILPLATVDRLIGIK